MEYMIYTLSDNYGVRYIGKTKDIKYRYYRHIYESKNGKTFKENWIKKTLLNNGKIILEILDVCNEETVDFFECYWISQFKTWGFELTNLTEGGDGGKPMKGRKMTQEQIKKMSDIAKINGNAKNIKGWNKGLKMEPSFGEKISCNRKGKKLSDDTKLKISHSLKGVKKLPMSDETKKKISLSKKGSPSPNKGKKFNDEYKKKLSLAKKGVKKSLSVVKQMSEDRKKIWYIETPHGDLLEFIGYNSFKEYVKINSSSVSVTSLKSNGSSQGWKIINKIKK